MTAALLSAGTEVTAASGISSSSLLLLSYYTEMVKYVMGHNC